MKKLQNFWFYYKKHLLVALAVASVACYLFLSSGSAPKADYHIGLVRAIPCTQEELSALEAVIAAAGEDANGDGTILVTIHTYCVDLADSSPNAGVTNAEIVAALDADLIGKVSGIFLLEDVDTFQRITNHILADSITDFGNGLFLTIRADAGDAYHKLLTRLS